MAIISAVWPYLGVPRDFKDFFTFALGIAIAFLAYSLWKKERNLLSKPDMPKSADTFVQNDIKTGGKSN